jgi:hypothetical protein
MRRGRYRREPALLSIWLIVVGHNPRWIDAVNRRVEKQGRQAKKTWRYHPANPKPAQCGSRDEAGCGQRRKAEETGYQSYVPWMLDDGQHLHPGAASQVDAIVGRHREPVLRCQSNEQPANTSYKQEHPGDIDAEP